MAKQPQRDALQMLADDHRTVEALFEKYDNARSTSVQAKIVRQICEEFYEAKVSVLKEQVEHHVYEEERQRGSMFAQVRKTDIDLDALGQEMAALKKQLQEQAKAGGLPQPEKIAL